MTETDPVASDQPERETEPPGNDEVFISLVNWPEGEYPRMAENPGE